MVEVSNPPIPQTPLWLSDDEEDDPPNGSVQQPWYVFFFLLWLRTGGQIDNVAGAAPIGSMSLFAGSTSPDGWLFCDGSAVSRETYSDLFNAIGVDYGAGDGSTTFNIPDFRGRSVLGAGQGSGLTNRSLGDTGGDESVTLVEGQLPTVTPSVNDPQHTHGITDPQHSHANSSGNFVNDGAGTEYSTTAGNKGALNANTGSSSTGITVNSSSTGITIDSFGNDEAHENMMPFGVANYIIRTGVV